jgi:quercetin 2,3-dioxygenase
MLYFYKLTNYFFFRNAESSIINHAFLNSVLILLNFDFCKNHFMIRKVRKIIEGKQTRDGAGVKLKRIFGNAEVPLFDPFLLLDNFGSDKTEDYIRGFPWHPHRGIETITYMLNGSAEHGDSIGNSGIISSGDVQWMTAGSGIIHQEMPKGDKDNIMSGFQLWANLPATHKMMTPRYRDIKKEQIPIVNNEKGISAHIICGEYKEVKGPVTEIITEPEYFDIHLEKNILFSHPVKPGHTVFIYVYSGSVIADGHPSEIKSGNAILFDDGDTFNVTSNDSKTKFIFVSGKPIGEPVAWYGPIVMNTEEELQIAFDEYEKGTFIKKHNENSHK